MPKMISSKYDWSETQIKVDGEKRQVLQLGTLGVFQLEYDTEYATFNKTVVVPRGWYSLIHIPSSNSIVRLPDLWEIQRIGEILWERCLKAISKKSREDVLANLPIWVKQWIKECTTKGQRVDSLPFRKKYGEQLINS